MFNKLLGLFSGDKDKNDKNNDEEVPGTPLQFVETDMPTPPVLDLSKYIHFHGNGLRIEDYRENLKELPDNFFEQYPHLVKVAIEVTLLASVPESIISLQQLKHLHISRGKFRSLPDISRLKSLEYLSFEWNSLVDLNKELIKLVDLPGFTTLHIGSYRGNTFPQNVLLLKNCTTIKIGSRLDKKLTIKDVCNCLCEMHWLKKLDIDIHIVNARIPDEILKLDFLDELTLSIYGKDSDLPSVLGLLRHVNLNEGRPVNNTIKVFREKYDSIKLSDQQRKLLFCFYVKNFSEIKDLLPFILISAHEQNEKKGIVPLSKLKGLSQKAIAEKLSSTSFYLAKSDDKGDLIYVAGTDTAFEVVEDLVLNNKVITFQEDLQELLIKLDDPWLLQKDNSGLNDQLLQLLASNQAENYKVAFEIIDGGGANRTIQALLAAIMLSHPDKTIAKSAEKLYDKYGSALFKEHCKKESCSLRMSGNTARKLSVLLKHPDIDEFVFRIMHHLIASNNSTIKDVAPHILELKETSIENIPDIIRFFSNIHTIDLSSCHKFNLSSAIPLFRQMTNLKHLSLNGSHLSIPSEIKELVQLKALEASFNEFADVSALGCLVNLTHINIEGCKINRFDWLAHLGEMVNLNLNNNNLVQVPPEVIQLSGLDTLTLKQNKIQVMDANLLKLTNLMHLDYSNNIISNIDYRYFGLQLETLLLRSNKIDSFDWKKIRDLDIDDLQLRELNLGSNKLSAFSLGSLTFPGLNYLDISNNNITELDSSIFKCPIMELYAGKNNITDIPDSITLQSHYTRIWLQDNQIKELKASFAKIRIENCDLSNNKIEKLHPDFEIEIERDHSRLYWKIRNNPVSKELKGIAGLHGY